MSRLLSLMPGLVSFKDYRREWFKDDLRAALSVSAVALPVGIAYAQLTGVNPLVGLYSCVLPMLVYALFGTSRQLIVGPDAATCAVIAAVVTPLAAGDTTKHWQLVMTMTAMTGIWCLIASRFKLGILADFLSKPILLGLINGVAITIIVGQASKVLGFSFNERYLLDRLAAAPNYLSEIHWGTLAMSFSAAALFFVVKRFRPSWPAAMIVIVLSSAAAWLFGLDKFDVKLVGDVTVDLMSMQMPSFDLGIVRELVMPALNLAMVSFVSMMLTARSFAAKNGYDIDPDKEFRALGLANLASAFSQGFAVSGADSRTAVNDASGGKTQLVSLIAALVIGVIAWLFTEPLAFIPQAALGVVLVVASWSLIDLKNLWRLRTRDRSAFFLALTTFVAVIFIGVIPGITLAVLLGLFQFLQVVMRPTDQCLGLDAKGTLRSLDGTDKAAPVPGVFIYRFNSPLTYFNASYFKRRLLEKIAAEPETPKVIIIDAVPCFTHPDISVMAMLSDLLNLFKRKQIRLILAGRKRQIMSWCDAQGIATGEGGLLVRSDLYLALKMSQTYKRALAEGQAPELKRPPEMDLVLEHSHL